MREAENHTHGLEDLASAVRYRRYLHSLIAPHCGRAMMEVGAGLGDLSEHFIGRERLVVTDADPACVATLSERFDGFPEVRVVRFDVADSAALAPMDAAVDTVLAVNVLEHIKDDAAALRTMARAVRPGGSVVLIVPAHPRLYGEFDRRCGHVRRYTHASMRDTVEAAGLTVEIVRSINFIGGIAWWCAVKIGKQTRPRPGLVKAYDRLVVPMERALAPLLRVRFGQSLLCVARAHHGNV